jgi:hypothetical protein
MKMTTELPEQSQTSINSKDDVISPVVKRSFGNGWRRPITDEGGLKWCNCSNPTLTRSIGRGQAWCMRCKEAYYH